MTRTCYLFIASFIVALLVAAFNYVVLDPKIGFDDANITQVYARNIAQGYGYVYNVGGERVEGNTSLLWTLINVSAFWLMGAPELYLAAICFGMTVATIFVAGQIAQMLTLFSYALFATVADFLVFPRFFGWMAWFLMDTALWVLLITGLFAVLVGPRTNRRGGSRPWVILGMLALLLPIARPEGIVLTTGLALVLLLRGLILREGLPKIALVLGLGEAVSFSAVTALRLQYFGYPFPNMFFAKVSADIYSQASAGLRYILSYLDVGHNVLLIALLCIVGITCRLMRCCPADG